MKPNQSAFLPVIALLLAACSPSANTPTPPQGPPVQATETSSPTTMPTTTSAYNWPEGSGACTLEVTQATDLYYRPSADAEVFSTLNVGFNQPVGERSADGWVGFDPGVAQAANMGIFRMRWVPWDAVSLSGDCVSVPQATWVPQPDLCYSMPMEEVTIYESTDNSGDVLGTMEVGDFAAIVGFTDNGWVQLDLEEGNSGLTGVGWMQQSDLNMNGGLCDELPTVAP